MFNKENFIIYGCTGYTGSLTARIAVEKGFKPILAGRNQEKVKALADELGLEHRVFDLNDTYSLIDALKPVKAILHCAGPFEFTSDQVVKACLECQTHYVDITGEIVVFEGLQQYDEAAKEKQIMIMPGGGFDVVPSDCLSNYLHKQLPDANQLNLALHADGGRLSHGTAITIVENMGRGGVIRKNGKMKKVGNAYDIRMFDFGFAEKKGVTIPWGDISTAYVSTGIPNIMVYNCLPPSLISKMKWVNLIRPILNLRFVKNKMIAKIKSGPAGPNAEQREKANSYIYGEVINEEGDIKKAYFRGPEGYTLTANTSLNIIHKILNFNFKAGFQTPSTAYGHELVLETKECHFFDLE